MSLEILQNLLQVPDLSDKKWIYEQYDSQVMNDTILTGGDASIVRVHGTKKALAMSVDCTPRYVEADSYEGAIQAVCETYRNISAVGAKPLAITNCLNFGNPQKPEIMGQIVRSIQGITKACKELDYPVVSGNVSLYNETDGKAIKPTPAIGGVGLLVDANKRCDTKFKKINDQIFVIGNTLGHLSCSIFEREILKVENQKNPPKVNLIEEKKNSEFVRNLISQDLINSCHDISDGGLLVTLFEKSTKELGCKIDISSLKNEELNDDNAILFGEDQSRYVISISNENLKDFLKIAEQNKVAIFKIGEVIKENINLNSQQLSVVDLQKISQITFEKNFS
jgi:phosphoribosylformylglycinamidine synthase